MPFRPTADARRTLRSLSGLALACLWLGACHGDGGDDGDDGCPDQYPAGDPCCEDTRACERVPISRYEDDQGAVVSLDTLGGPSTLQEALASEWCSRPVRACDVVEVVDLPVGTIIITSVYDAQTGERVGAQGVTNERYTRRLDGCCGDAFTAGRLRPDGCSDIEPLSCTLATDEDAGL